MSGPSLGTNLSSIVDWTTAFPFIDLFKMSRAWYTQSDSQWDTREADQLVLDDAGWVEAFHADGETPAFTRVSTILNTGGDYLKDGIYVLDWVGDGEVDIVGGQIISRDDHRILIDPGDGAIEIQIRSTDPDDTGDYVRDIRFYAQEDAALLDAGLTFNPDFIDRIQDFRVLRFMDWMGTNGSNVTDWSDMTPEDAARYSLWGEGGGPSIEVMVALANETGADPWFNIPHQADDAYVEALATYVRDHLDEGLVARFEFSNEVWNWGFAQAQYAQAQAQELWGDDVEGGWMQWYGMRASQVAEIVADVFGDQTGERALNVFSTQSGWWGLEQYALDAPDYVADGGTAPRDAPFHVYAIAPYFGGSIGSEEMKAQVDTWIDMGEAGVQAALDYIQNGPAGDSLANIGDAIAYHAGVAQGLGWQLEAYEGGQHIVDLAGLFGGGEDPDRTAFFIDLAARPELGEFSTQYFETWRDSGGGLMAQFSDFGPASRYGSWGIWDSVNGPDTPRSLAVEHFRDRVDAWWSDDRPVSVFEGVHTLIDRDGADALTGGAYADRLFGLDGKDVLSGRGGDDILIGGAGRDTLDGGSGTDQAVFGGDRAEYAFRFKDGVLVVSGPDGVDRLTGIEQLVFDDMTIDAPRLGIVWKGDGADDNRKGTSGDDSLNGAGGNDVIKGLAGADILKGGQGDDVLTGGAGIDVLTGGSGADHFVFANGDLGAPGGMVERITDFRPGQGDIVDLRDIDADVHTSGDQAFTKVDAFGGHAGQYVWQPHDGYGLALFDVNGDGIADLALWVDGGANGVDGWWL